MHSHNQYQLFIRETRLHKAYEIEQNHFQFIDLDWRLQIAAAALYIICRQEDHPFMLLDFADVLQVNVFHLGSVFLQLCSILRLEDHPIVTK